MADFVLSSNIKSQKCLRLEEGGPRLLIAVDHILILPAPETLSCINLWICWDQLMKWKNGMILGVLFAWNPLIMVFFWDALPMRWVVVLICATPVTGTPTASTNSVSRSLLISHQQYWNKYPSQTQPHQQHRKKYLSQAQSLMIGKFSHSLSTPLNVEVIRNQSLSALFAGEKYMDIRFGIPLESIWIRNQGVVLRRCVNSKEHILNSGSMLGWSILLFDQQRWIPRNNMIG